MKYDKISMIGNDKVRFILKKEGRNPLIILGINPSTADESTSDHTIRKVMGYADRWGFDSFIMINVYPERTNNPFLLSTSFDRIVRNKNLEFINDVLSSYPNSTLLMAYGNSIQVRAYLKECLKDILRLVSNYHEVKTIQLGSLTTLGNPRHPLTTPYSIITEPYNPNKLEK